MNKDDKNHNGMSLLFYSPLLIRRLVRIVVLMAIDMLCICLALYVASNIRFEWNIPLEF